MPGHLSRSFGAPVFTAASRPGCDATWLAGAVAVWPTLSAGRPVGTDTGVAGCDEPADGGLVAPLVKGCEAPALTVGVDTEPADVVRASAPGASNTIENVD